jgi:sensor histidine kinase YesM
MEKSKNYAPYLFAFFIPLFAAVTNKLLFKPGIVLSWITYSFFLLGLWRLIEWILTLTSHYNKLVQWGSVFLSAGIYSFVFMSLDYYVLDLLMSFSGFSPLDIAIKSFITIAIATIYIESVKWSRAREKARIDNLKLQAENIDARFQLLKEQVNPEFLFHSLKTLRAMVKKDDPNTEGYVLKLANVYRQILNQDKNVGSLKEELDLLQNYMFLMRYGREAAISFEAAVSEASLKAHLPMFALQNLGDNCIKNSVFSENQPLHIRLFQKEATSVTLSQNYPQKSIAESRNLNMEHLTMRYELEGIENGVLIEQDGNTYSTTLKLF